MKHVSLTHSVYRAQEVSTLKHIAAFVMKSSHYTLLLGPLGERETSMCQKELLTSAFRTKVKACNTYLLSESDLLMREERVNIPFFLSVR